MVKDNIIRGTFPAIVTPMMRDGDRLKHEINYDVLPKYLDFLAKYVDGFVVCGCTGADALLDHDEQLEFIKKVNENVQELEKTHNKPLLVIAGDGSNFTYEACELAKRVEGETGVTHHLQISPYKVKPTQDGIKQHYEAVAKGIEGNIIMYSVNGRTGGVGIEPETALYLAQHPQIVAIKEATAGEYVNGLKKNVLRAEKVMQGVKEKGLDFTVLSGDDDATLEMMRHGATGVISVTANVAPFLVSRMVSYESRGASDRADKYYEKLQPLFDVLFTENNPQDVMYALNHMGFDVGVGRLPLMETTKDAKQKIGKVIDDIVS